MFELNDRVALVTGGAGLLGRRHASALARFGASVVVADMDLDAANAIASEISSTFDATVIGCDMNVTDTDSIRSAMERVESELGAVDILINNAAIDDKVESPSDATASAFENYPLERWRRAFEVNVTGVFLCCQSFGTAMAQRGHGSIVNVGSTYGLVSPDQSLYEAPDGTRTFFKSAAYPSTKGAVLSLTRYLATYWGKAGVRVNALCPGGVGNGQNEHFVEKYEAKTPMGRMARVDDYEGAIVFLASDASSYMTGTNLVVDGGFTAW